MIPPSMYGVRSMNVVRFLIQETGTFDQQYRRPFNTDLDHNSQSLILDTVSQAKTITPSSLANVASSFVRPAATPESPLQIINGWNERRFRFLLEVQTVDRTQMMVTKEYITGYTDYIGQSFGGALDNNMRFFVNAVNTTRESVQHTPLGTQVHQNMLDSSHILVNNQYSAVNGPNQMFGLRPEDVYDQIDSRVLKESVDDGFIVDGRSLITTFATKSKRANAVAPVYMAEVLNSYLQTARNQKDESQQVIMEAARHTVESGAVTDDPFMMFVRSCSMTTGGNSFTLGDLDRLDAGARSKIHVDEMNDMKRSTLNVAGANTNGWGGADYHTLFATTLAQSLPSYMLTFGITKIKLRSTNMDFGSAISTHPENVKSFNNGLDNSRNISALIFRFETELLKNLSQNGMLGFAVDIECDLLGETKMMIKINDSAFVPYVLPSFCDSLMAPVVTSNYNTLDGAANDFGSLMTQIYEQDAALAPGGAMRTGLL